MPSTLCRCTAATGPLTGKAVLDSRAHSCSNRLLRSILSLEWDKFELELYSLSLGSFRILFAGHSASQALLD